MPLEGPGFGGAPFQSQRGPNKSRLWNATIRRRRSRRCDLTCRMSMGAFSSLRYRRWKVGHLGLVACPLKLLQGRWPIRQRAHAPATPDTKPYHDMHGGPAGCVHISINTKVTVSMCKHVCTQPTCKCATSNEHPMTVYTHSRKTRKLHYARRYVILLPYSIHRVLE